MPFSSSSGSSDESEIERRQLGFPYWHRRYCVSLDEYRAVQERAQFDSFAWEEFRLVVGAYSPHRSPWSRPPLDHLHRELPFDESEAKSLLEHVGCPWGHRVRKLLTKSKAQIQERFWGWPSRLATREREWRKQHDLRAAEIAARPFDPEEEEWRAAMECYPGHYVGDED